MNCLFICVNFNGSDVTKKFLSSVASLGVSDSNLRISAIIVDNASDAEDISNLDLLVSQNSFSSLIKSKINLGYFGGLNLGISNIDPSQYDFIVVCNNDVTFRQNFAHALASRKYQSNIFVVAPNVITADGYNQNPHCIGRVSSLRKFLYRIYYLNFNFARLLTLASHLLNRVRGGKINKSAQVSQIIHMGIGACYILTPSFFRRYSLLDDSVFLYGEEALLAGQVMAASGKTYYDSGLVVNHAESATLSKLSSRKVYEFAKQSYPKFKKYL